MRLSTLAYFYGRRLRTHPIQELLAGLGIAVGVALVFAVQVANSSITDGSSQIVHSIVGAAGLQLSAQGSSGFDEHLRIPVQRLPGVQRVAPMLELNATVSAPSGRVLKVRLAGANVALAALDDIDRVPFESIAPNSVILSIATARALGISTTPHTGQRGPPLKLLLWTRGRSAVVTVDAILTRQQAGALSSAIAVMAPLTLVQRIGDLPGRITRLLVETFPGDASRVRARLGRIAAGKLAVRSSTVEVGLLRQATIPNGQATGFFAFVSGLVGVLLVFTAMLLSAPARRRMIADLRINGARKRDLVKLLLFQAACLGIVASIGGVAIGELLSRGVFHETPGYLASAFALGSQTVVGWQPVVFSLIGGTLVTCVAAAPPLLDLKRSRAVDGVYFEGSEPGPAMSGRARLWLFGAGLTLVTASAVLSLAFGSRAAAFAIVGLAGATLLIIPFCFALALSAAQLLADRKTGLNMLLVATRSLRATTVRSLALAAMGAIAVFGSVAAEGAHNDLLTGLYRDYSQYVTTADLWVTNRKDDLATDSFPDGGLAARIARLPGVASVRPYQGGFLDVDGRRVWVIARSPSARSMFPKSQILEGNPVIAGRLIQKGGWIAVSRQIAQAAHVGVGQMLTLPTPSGPVSYRIAATTSNLGWAAGAIVLNDSDYRRAWGTTDLSAIEIDKRPNASTAEVKQSIARVLGPDGGLRVQTSTERAAQADALAREGLSRLTQISLLLKIAAALAMAAAMGASIWQRRISLSSLRIQSFQPSQLRVVLLWETLIVLGTGCAVGALAGIFGHEQIDRYLRLVTGFPAPFSPALPQMIATTSVIIAGALLVLVVPGYLASRVPASVALEE